MGLGTKNRQNKIAEICRAHLRGKYRAQAALVEEFIIEFEGAEPDIDVTRWSQFADVRRIQSEMLERLDAHFEEWLNPA